MLRKELIVAYGESYVEHINTLCGKSAEFSVLNLVVYVLTTSVYWSGESRVAPIADMLLAIMLINVWKLRSRLSRFLCYVVVEKL
jgi:hypothetical protein